MPSTVRGAFAGTAATYQQSQSNMPMLFGAALLTIYIVLGILYESLIHPITILSTLFSASVGAALALWLFDTPFTVIAAIGVLLLIGIVKKNAIMMVDFAIEAQRRQGSSAREAIEQACLLRFRPIMMTTFAAIFGALPLAFGTGEGSELRHPLGITIVGGLVVSQVLTLYTTPVVFIYLDSFGNLLGRLWNRYYLRVDPAPGAWRAADDVCDGSCMSGAARPPSAAARRRAGPLAGCAPVGPDFLRPAALVSPQFKEVAGWKVATPRAGEPKGDWWSAFHDPELARLEAAVAISNQTVKADEANYREALALINEARAGLFPTVNGTGSATRSAHGGNSYHDVDRRGVGIVDARRMGRGAARDRGADGRRGSERRHSRQRIARGAVGARPGLRPGARGRFARGPADHDRRGIQALADDHAEPVSAPARRRSPMSSPPRRRCSTPRRSSSPRA